MIALKLYCPLCGSAVGSGHKPWCPSNDDITCNDGIGRNTR